MNRLCFLSSPSDTLGFRARLAFQRALVMIVLVLLGAPVWAHDPLEITATLYFRSNQVELFAEMEMRPARVLAGGKSEFTYEQIITELQNRAASCFQVTSGSKVIAAASASAVAAEEQHVQLRLIYPRPASSSFQLEAPMLSELAADGPYGVGLTALDMVHQKVVGQSVLFADHAVTPVLQVLPVEVESTGPAGTPSARTSDPVVQPGLPAAVPDYRTAGDSRPVQRFFWWIPLAVSMAFLLWFWFGLGKRNEKAHT